MTEYKIQGETLTGIADQVRRISGVEGELTPEQMTTNLLNVTPLGEYPKAEEAAFGVAEDKKTGIIAHGDVGKSSTGNIKTYGWKFEATEAFSIVGFRQKHDNTYEKQMTLWDSSGNSVAIITTSDTATDWISYYLDTPINVAIGETYTVSVRTKYPSYITASEATFNSKLTFINVYMTSNNQMPTGSGFGALYNIDIIIAPVSAELPNDYQIARTTMDDIAEEVQRITGTESKMTTAQITTSLSEIVVHKNSEEVAF